MYVYIYIYISAVKQLIMINPIQNKSFVYAMCVYCVYLLCIYKFTYRIYFEKNIHVYNLHYIEIYLI